MKRTAAEAPAVVKGEFAAAVEIVAANIQR